MKNEEQNPTCSYVTFIKTDYYHLNITEKKNSIRDDLRARKGVFLFMCLQVKELDLFIYSSM